MARHTLHIGFDQSKDPQEAVREALEEFREAAERDGLVLVGPVNVELDRDDPEHTAMGEYVVVISGERGKPDGNE